MDATAQTLAVWRSSRFDYATGNDCLMSLADHVLRVTGRDYGRIWRDTYMTEAEAFAQVKAWGGAQAMIDLSGLERTTEPRRGDIVLVRVKDAEIGGIFTGDSVAMRLPRGVGEVNSKLVKIIAAWRVE